MIKKLLIALLICSIPFTASAHRVKSPFAVEGVLGADPDDCGANAFAVSIDDSANLTCSAITDDDIPDDITIDLAATATALATNPTACTAGQFVEDIDADGTLACATPGGNFGRGVFVICGDATTVNNNTVFYGPDLSLSANNEGFNCDINAVGGAVEADEDEPIYTNQEFLVASMTCRNEGDADASISYTLRNDGGNLTPSVTCTIADNERDCVANVQTTTTVHAADAVALAVASTSDVGNNNGFICTVQVRFPVTP